MALNRPTARAMPRHAPHYFETQSQTLSNKKTMSQPSSAIYVSDADSDYVPESFSSGSIEPDHFDSYSDSVSDSVFGSTTEGSITLGDEDTDIEDEVLPGELVPMLPYHVPADPPIAVPIGELVHDPNYRPIGWRPRLPTAVEARDWRVLGEHDWRPLGIQHIMHDIHTCQCTYCRWRTDR